MNEFKSKALRRPIALADTAAGTIRRAIIEGEFALGDPLPETLLSKKLGISKTPIREALSLLKKEGLVVSISQRGSFVFTLTIDCIHQLCAYRYAIETLAIDMALAHAEDQLISDLGQVCENMEQAHSEGDFHAYLELDSAFHDAFFANSGNGYLKASYQAISSKIATIRTHLSRGHSRTDLSLKEHLKIYEHLRSGNVRSACSILKKQIFRGHEVYPELIPAADAGAH